MTKNQEETSATPVNTTGELRLVANRDGWFVVGNGLQFPVEDRAQGLELITRLKSSGNTK